ncbi:hypothetical protein KFE25_007242 [Diacronema lutheri]|uniref:Uncharacterized protein n=1 Tax=Diacronema lutheri TaxID=2081491 RepID=A0A8J5XC81_DIALT|nr:hypothetical protein KFE25_007242 [Diacronema lutheri]
MKFGKLAAMTFGEWPTVDYKGFKRFLSHAPHLEPATSAAFVHELQAMLAEIDETFAEQEAAIVDALLALGDADSTPGTSADENGSAFDARAPAPAPSAEHTCTTPARGDDGAGGDDRSACGVDVACLVGSPPPLAFYYAAPPPAASALAGAAGGTHQRRARALTSPHPPGPSAPPPPALGARARASDGGYTDAWDTDVSAAAFADATVGFSLPRPADGARALDDAHAGGRLLDARRASDSAFGTSLGAAEGRARISARARALGGLCFESFVPAAAGDGAGAAVAAECAPGGPRPSAGAAVPLGCPPRAASFVVASRPRDAVPAATSRAPPLRAALAAPTPPACARYARPPPVVDATVWRGSGGARATSANTSPHAVRAPALRSPRAPAPPGSAAADARARATLHRSALTLRAYCLVQFVAVLKIVKKHDKALRGVSELLAGDDGDEADDGDGGVDEPSAARAALAPAAEPSPQPNDAPAAEPSPQPLRLPLRLIALRLLTSSRFVHALLRSRLFAAVARCARAESLALNMIAGPGAGTGPGPDPGAGAGAQRDGARIGWDADGERGARANASAWAHAHQLPAVCAVSVPHADAAFGGAGVGGGGKSGAKHGSGLGALAAALASTDSAANTRPSSPPSAPPCARVPSPVAPSLPAAERTSGNARALSHCAAAADGGGSPPSRDGCADPVFWVGRGSRAPSLSLHPEDWDSHDGGHDGGEDGGEDGACEADGADAGGCARSLEGDGWSGKGGAGLLLGFADEALSESIGAELHQLLNAQGADKYQPAAIFAEARALAASHPREWDAAIGDDDVPRCGARARDVGARAVLGARAYGRSGSHCSSPSGSFRAITAGGLGVPTGGSAGAKIGARARAAARAAVRAFTPCVVDDGDDSGARGAEAGLAFSCQCSDERQSTAPAGASDGFSARHAGAVDGARRAHDAMRVEIGAAAIGAGLPAGAAVASAQRIAVR